jgi:hypothetical protein
MQGAPIALAERGGDSLPDGQNSPHRSVSLTAPGFCSNVNLYAYHVQISRILQPDAQRVFIGAHRRPDYYGAIRIMDKTAVPQTFQVFGGHRDIFARAE